MKLWPTIKKILTYQEPPAQESFSLDGRMVPDDPDKLSTEDGNQTDQQKAQGTQQPSGNQQEQQPASQQPTGQQQGQQPSGQQKEQPRAGQQRQPGKAPEGQPAQETQTAGTRKESWFSNIVQPKKIEELASQIEHIKQPATKAGKDGAGKKIVSWSQSRNKSGSKPGNQSESKTQQPGQQNTGQAQQDQNQGGQPGQQANQAQPTTKDQGQGTGSQDQSTPGQAGQDQPAKNQAGQPQPAQSQASHSGQNTPAGGGKPSASELSTDIDQNLGLIDKAFLYGTNADIIIRKFVIPLNPPVRAFIVFLEGMADKKVINRDILEPLMRPIQIQDEISDAFTVVKERLLPGNQVKKHELMKDISESILAGNTALFIDGFPAALLADTKGIPAKSIERPQSEMVVRGPQEAFTELLRTNTGLVRKRLRTEHLITEMLKIGALSHSDVAVMYIKGVVNPKLVAEVKRRLQAIKADYLSSSGIVEQFIEDRPFFLFPQVLSTERPDRVAAFLTEGHVAILVNSTPFALVVPVSFWSLLQSSEDMYIRWPYGIFLRIIRVMAIILAVLLPGLYLAMVNYHWEMIPTDLLLAIAASREKVPFPVVVEVFLMELSFEIIREAGIRIPNVIGPTIGIVGALILGQAAVAASIISPILIIIVAMTALGSFVVPNLALSFAVRLIRFYYIVLAAFFGFFGIAVGLFVHLISTVNLKSFGVPIFAPVTPRQPSGGDVILRLPVWMQGRRPEQVEPLDDWRQETITRPWEDITPGGVMEPGEINQQERAKEEARPLRDPKGDGQGAQ